MKLNRVIFKTAGLYVRQNGVQWIRCSFSFDQTVINEIKKITGKEWLTSIKSWLVPLSLENCYRLKELQFSFHADLKLWANQEWKRKNQNYSKLVLPDVNKTLRPYQRDGVIGLEKLNGNALLADEMGLGKTLQAIVWLLLRKELRPVIIVCPGFLKYVWYNELLAANVTDIQMLFGQKAEESLTASILLINYDILKFWEKKLIAYDAKLIIIDEAHYIASDSAQRTQSCKRIAKKIPHRMGITGTPFETKVAQIYNIVNLINPALFPVKLSFLYEYCGPKNNGFAMTFNGATKIPKLSKILRENVLIRRLKQDVAKDLPEKIYNFIPIELTNKSKYYKALDNFKNYLKGKVLTNVKRELVGIDNDLINVDFKALKKVQKKEAKKANYLYLMSELRQILIKGKINGITEWVDNFLDSGEKLVIFCEHIWTIDYLMEKYEKIAVKIDGSVSPKNKSLTVEKFQTDKKIKLIICNRAGQEGLTMTAASNLAHIEFPRTPGALAQRTDRIHRIGAVNTCFIHYLVALGTIEEKGIRKLDEKARTFSQVLDGKDIEKFDLMSYLIDEIYAETN